MRAISACGLLALVLGCSVASASFLETDRVCSEQYSTNPHDCHDYIKSLRRQAEDRAVAKLELARALLNISYVEPNPDNAGKARAEAVSLLNSLIEADPTDGAALFLLSTTANPEDQVSMLRHTLSVEPDNFEAAVILSQLLLSDDAPAAQREAAAVLHRAFAASERESKLPLGVRLVRLYESAGMLDEGARFKRTFATAILDGATNDVERVQRLCSYAGGYAGLSAECFETAHGLAIDFTRAGEPFPDYLLDAFGSLLQTRDDTNVDRVIAMRDLLEAQMPYSADNSLFYRTYSLVLSGERRIQSLETAVSLNPSDHKSMYWLADTLIEAGEYDKAKGYLEHLVDYGSDFEDVARFHLQRLKADNVLK